MEFVYRRSYRGRLQGIILDWAGTMIDFGSRAPAGVFMEVFKDKGVTVTQAEARGPMGMHKRDHIRVMTKMPRVAAAWQTVHGSAPTADDIEAMFEAFIPKQLEILADYSTLIPGMLDAASAFREMGLKIGSSTGYNQEMVEIILAETKKQGFEPDYAIGSSEVPAGRPAPWLCLQNAMHLNIYPFEACVKVDDTLPGITAGLNAGMWTIGVAFSGNGLGLSAGEANALEPELKAKMLAPIYEAFARAGAHYVVDGIWDIPTVLQQINARLARGERP